MSIKPVNIEKSAQEVLNLLDRWDAKLNDHCTPKREHKRKGYRGRMRASFPMVGTDDCTTSASDSFIVWARNLSRSGLSFIYNKELPLRDMLLCLNTDTKGDLWYIVTIVRKRQVHNNFWEFGAELKERVTI